MTIVPIEWEPGWATELVLKVWRRDKSIFPAGIEFPIVQPRSLSAQLPIWTQVCDLDTRVD